MKDIDNGLASWKQVIIITISHFVDIENRNKVKHLSRENRKVLKMT